MSNALEVQLQIAAFEGKTDQLSRLLTSDDVIPDAVDEDLTSPLMLASVRGHLGCVRNLVEAGAFVNARRCTGSTALFLAAQSGHIDVIKYLLDKGALLEAQCNVKLNQGIRFASDVFYNTICRMNGATPLFVASQMGQVGTVRLLCDRGANVHLPLKDRSTPLFVAAQNGHDLVAQHLIKCGADVNSRRDDGTSPLWIATQMGHITVTETLLNAGANVDRPRNTDGVTAIFKAACEGHRTIAQRILTKNPNLAIQKCGYSPLHAAAYFGQMSLVQLLLEHGANPDLLDKDGCTAAEVSGRRGYESVSRLIASNQGFSF